MSVQAEDIQLQLLDPSNSALDVDVNSLLDNQVIYDRYVHDERD